MTEEGSPDHGFEEAEAGMDTQADYDLEEETTALEDGADTEGRSEDRDGSETVVSFGTGGSPLGDLTARIRERQEADSGDGPTAVDDLFEAPTVESIDSEKLWEQLDREETVTDLVRTERDVREISKRSYCRQCEHFSEPPEVACTNTGTEILELTGMDTVRVADCPIVLEEEELEGRF